MSVSKAVLVILVCVTATCRSSFTSNIKKRFLEGVSTCSSDRDCNEGHCVTRSDGARTCNCKADAWVGTHCNILEWTLHSCSTLPCVHGVCHERDSQAKCICNNGWSGINCDDSSVSHSGSSSSSSGSLSHTGSSSSSSSSSADCVDHSTRCKEWADNQECRLNPGYMLKYCKQSCSNCHTAGSHTTDHCNNDCLHGQCTHYTTHNYYSCTCDAGWKGGFCQFQVSGHTDHCHNDCKHGNCTYSSYYNSYSCTCEAGWTGSHCDSQARCGQHHCMHGRCHHYTSGYRNCNCDHGWTGYECNQAVAGTHMDHCMNNCQHGQCELPSGQTHYLCSCDAGWTGIDCDRQAVRTTQTTTTATTTTSTTTTPPTTSTTTTAKAIVQSTYVCNKFDVINAIAHHIISNNAVAATCRNGQQVSPEAFVLDHCNTTIPSSWRQGINVMSSCDTLELYIPIAMFVKGVYQHTTGGIFLGCLQNGFRIGIQTCDNAPLILHAEHTPTSPINPDNFFVIQ